MLVLSWETTGCLYGLLPDLRNRTQGIPAQGKGKKLSDSCPVMWELQSWYGEVGERSTKCPCLFSGYELGYRTQRAGRSTGWVWRHELRVEFGVVFLTAAPLVRGASAKRQRQDKKRWLLWTRNQDVNRFVSLYTFASLPCFWPDLPMLAKSQPDTTARTRRRHFDPPHQPWPFLPAVSGLGDRVVFTVFTDPICPMKNLAGLFNPGNSQCAAVKVPKLLWPKAGRMCQHDNSVPDHWKLQASITWGIILTLLFYCWDEAENLS